jgi:hypothetical protein
MNKCGEALKWAKEGGLVVGPGLPEWIQFNVHEEDGLVILDAIRSGTRKAKHLTVALDRPIPKWLQLGKIDCHFQVKTLGIKTLRGFPARVEGDLIISFCSSLENFEGMPEVIKGKIWMIGTRAKTIDGFNHTLRKVGGDLDELRRNIHDFKAYEFFDMIVPGPTNEKD